MFSGGPNLSRYYFARGDHWIVRQDDRELKTVLEQKKYSWLQFFAPSFVLPGITLLAGIAYFLATADAYKSIVILMLSVVLACILVAIYRLEWVQLYEQPSEPFVWHPSGIVEINGIAFESRSAGYWCLEYSYYPSGTSNGYGAYSELDVIIKDGVEQRRINLLSQKSNWALKHARKLSQATQISLVRKVVTT